ncbi:MAG: META domain-containing protein [Bdellovibrionales bacterium]
MIAFSKNAFLTLAVVALSACANITPPKELPRASYFTCGDMPLSSQMGEDMTLRLNAGGNLFSMVEVPSPSDKKYENLSAQPQISFWDKGNTAVLEIEGKAFPTCMKVIDPESTPVKTYRAIGNDPAWFLNIQNGKFILNSRYGQKIATADLPEPKITNEGLSYHLKTGLHDLVISVARRSCQDSKTGLYYPDQVTILFYGEKMKGCGNEISLKPLPEMPLIVSETEAPAPAALTIPTAADYIGKTWVARQIDGRDVLTPSRLTLRFEKDGKLSGQSGCHDLTGTYTIDGHKIKLNAMAAGGKVLCAPDLIKQGKIFETILNAGTLIDLRDGTVILSTPHRKTLTFAQSSKTEPLVVVP